MIKYKITPIDAWSEEVPLAPKFMEEMESEELYELWVSLTKTLVKERKVEWITLDDFVISLASAGE